MSVVFWQMAFKRKTNLIIITSAVTTFAMVSCREDEIINAPEPTHIVYRTDQRTVSVSDINPIALDIDDDGSVDYTVFAQLTANSQGDHLYIGINPIGANTIKSGPPDNGRFLNMGFLVSEATGQVINSTLGDNQRWTSDHSMMVVRHTRNDGSVTYEGNWGSGLQSMVAIKQVRNDGVRFGWLNLHFDPDTELTTLIEYAYQLYPGTPIRAGEK